VQKQDDTDKLKLAILLSLGLPANQVSVKLEGMLTLQPEVGYIAAGFLLLDLLVAYCHGERQKFVVSKR
jgi:hypothetical protein